MARSEPTLASGSIIGPNDPEGRRAGFERLLRSDRFADHRRRLRAEIEHWPLRKVPAFAGYTVKERSPSEEAEFRRAITRSVLDAAIFHCWLYYREFLPEGDAKVRRGRAAVTTTADRAAKLATAMRQLWRSGDPAVRQILGPLATPYPRGDGLPVVSIVLRPESPQAEDQPPNVIGDPGVVVLLEEMRRRVELLATALPADVGGRRPSVVFAQLEQWLEGIYSEITGQPARFSGRAGARAGRFFRFVKAVVAWLSDAASDLSGVKFDLPATEDALRMALHRLVQANTTPVFQVTGFVQKSIASAIPGSSAGFILDYTNRYPKCLRVAKCKCY